MSEAQLEETWKLRNQMNGDALEYTEQFRNLLKNTKNNQELLHSIKDLTVKNTSRRNQKRS